MLSEITKVLIKGDVSDRTKFEIINRFYSDKPEKLSYCIQIGAIKDKLKIRMLNYLIKHLIKSGTNEALVTAFLILSHENYSPKIRRITHEFLKIYNNCAIEKHKKNESMLSDILQQFED